MLYSFRSFWHNANVKAVFPEPTGLGKDEQDNYTQGIHPIVPPNADGKPTFSKIPR